MGQAFSDKERIILFYVLDEIAYTGKTKYNPLFICGEEKETTMIISNFACRYAETFPTAKIKRFSGESFIEEIISRIRNDKFISAKEEFGDTDLMIIEKTELICGKRYPSELIYSAFDIVTERGGLVIFTSEMLPNMMCNIEPRNLAQLEGGLIINLHYSDIN